jgi:hypothetical protein
VNDKSSVLEQLPFWVLTANSTDWPGCWVVRKHIWHDPSQQYLPTDEFMVSMKRENIDMEMMQKGLTYMTRISEDHPHIVGTYF